MNITRFMTRNAAGALAMVVATCAIVTPVVAQADSPGPSTSEILAAFQVTDAELMDLPPGATLGRPFSAFVPLDDATHELRLAPHSVRAAGYRVIVAAGDGTYTDVPPGPVRTYRGHVVGDDVRVVAASLLPLGLFARIILGDGREYWIEPVASKLPAAAPGLHIVYRAADSYAPTGPWEEVSATAGAFRSDPDGGGSFRTGEPPCVTGLCLAEIAFDTDVEFNDRYGLGAEDRVNLILNTVNIQYERDVFIRMEISAIILRTSEPDPYSTTTLTPLLGALRSQWQDFHTDIPRDIVHFLAGRDISAGFVGGSYNSTVCDSVFTGSGYALVETDYNNSFPHTTDLTARMLGHNWGAANHSPDTCYDFDDPSTWDTMHRPADPPLHRFLPPCSVPEIEAFRESAYCLVPYVPPSDSPTAFPFFDSFDTTTIDTTKWTAVIGATVSTLGIDPPSPPYALNLGGNSYGGDEVRTGVIDLSGVAPGSFVLEYDWQEQGAGQEPANGRNLNVEYLDTDGAWIRLNAHYGFGSPSGRFTHAIVRWLPIEAYHAGFRLRFRVASPRAAMDDWLIDDVQMYSTASASPTQQNTFDLATDPGWSYAAGWAFGVPTGGGTGTVASPGHDPTSGHTGGNVIGYNLAGNYTNNLPRRDMTMRTPDGTGGYVGIDCSHLSNAQLRYWRWLGCENSTFDNAGIEVSNDDITYAVIWQNGPGSMADAVWSPQVLDISGVADHQPNVYIRFVMGPTDSSTTAFGWNIDDVEIWGVDTRGACCHPRGCSIVNDPAACGTFVCDVQDHLPPTFTGCYGDADGNGFVNPGDRGFVAANIGSTDPVHLCVFDMDGNGFINPGDRGFVAVNIGLCTPLPDFQDGSGMNGGAPDTRFGTATFQGAGTTCADVECP